MPTDMSPIKARNWLKKYFWEHRLELSPNEPWANAGGGCDDDNFICYISPIEMSLHKQPEIEAGRIKLSQTLHELVTKEFPYIDCQVEVYPDAAYRIAVFFERDEPRAPIANTLVRFTEPECDAIEAIIDEVIKDLDELQDDMTVKFKLWYGILKKIGAHETAESWKQSLISEGFINKF